MSPHTGKTLLPQTHPVYAVASGKGGVGKTGFTLNLATLLAKQGKKVLVLDGDTGLANADVQLNIQPERDLAHYIGGQFALRHIITATPQGFDIIAGRAGYQGLVNFQLPRLTNMMGELHDLATQYDVTLVDTAAGVSPQVLLMAAQSTATLLVATPDPSSLTDAYAFVKLMWQDHACANAHLVANQASATEGKMVHTRLSTAMDKFLKLPPLPLLGVIPSDRLYAGAVRNHQLAAIAFPTCPAIKAITQISHNLPA